MKSLLVANPRSLQLKVCVIYVGHVTFILTFIIDIEENNEDQEEEQPFKNVQKCAHDQSSLGNEAGHKKTKKSAIEGIVFG